MVEWARDCVEMHGKRVSVYSFRGLLWVELNFLIASVSKTMHKFKKKKKSYLTVCSLNPIINNSSHLKKKKFACVLPSFFSYICN